MAKRLGYGTELLLGDGASPEAFDSIAALKDFDLPTGEADQVDVTTHDSPDRTKEYISGLFETGEVGFEVLWDPAVETTHQDLFDLKATGDTRNWKVTDPDGIDYEFAAFVTALEIGHPVADAITAKITIKISGDVEMTV
jgi:predicted secreted protein